MDESMLKFDALDLDTDKRYLITIDPKYAELAYLLEKELQRIGIDKATIIVMKRNHLGVFEITDDMMPEDNGTWHTN